MMRHTLKRHPVLGFTYVVGIGGIGSGVLFQFEDDHTLGRDESRLGRLLPARDYCKLHIVEHYLATLMGSGKNCGCLPGVCYRSYRGRCSGPST